MDKLRYAFAIFLRPLAVAAREARVVPAAAVYRLALSCLKGVLGGTFAVDLPEPLCIPRALLSSGGSL